MFDPSPQKKRKQRANVQAFAAAIASPVASPVLLPAGARIAFVATAPAIAGATAGVITGASTRTILTPIMVAGERIVIDWAEKNSVVTIGTGFDLHVNTKFGEYSKIGNP